MDRFASLSAVLVASSVVLAARTPRAEACSPPPAVWVTEPTGTPITAVPVQGVVPIFSQNEPGSEDLVAVTVRDASEQDVAGSFEVLRWRLVWRSDAPLEAGTTYTMSIEDDWGQLTEVVFVTAGEGDPAPPAVSLAGAASLGEEARADSKVCCEGEDIDTCSGLLEEHCWAQSYVYLPALSLSFEIDDDARRYARFEVDAGGAEVANLLDQRGLGQVGVVYGGLQQSYCATVTATSLLDGSTESAQRCVDDAERVPAQPAEPEQPDYTSCGGDGDDDEEPWDYDDWDEDEWKTDGEDHGCSAARGGGGGLLALLTVLPLAARRARRRRRG